MRQCLLKEIHRGVAGDTMLATEIIEGADQAAPTVAVLIEAACPARAVFEKLQQEIEHLHRFIRVARAHGGSWFGGSTGARYHLLPRRGVIFGRGSRRNPLSPFYSRGSKPRLAPHRGRCVFDNGRWPFVRRFMRR